MSQRRDDSTGEPMGFAGFGALISNIDSVVEAVRRTPKHERTAVGPGATSGSNQGGVFAGEPSSLGSGHFWFWGVVGAIVVAVLIADVVERGSSTGPQTNRPSSAVTPTPTVVSDPTEGGESLPPVGTDLVLGGAQLRYCLSESIRLDAAKQAVSDNDIERFNRMVDDFNSRCGSFRYRRSAFDSVKRQVEADRPSLQAQGVARFRR